MMRLVERHDVRLSSLVRCLIQDMMLAALKITDEYGMHTVDLKKPLRDDASGFDDLHRSS